MPFIGSVDYGKREAPRSNDEQLTMTKAVAARLFLPRNMTKTELVTSAITGYDDCGGGKDRTHVFKALKLSLHDG